jgi:hypothetical protein
MATIDENGNVIGRLNNLRFYKTCDVYLVRMMPLTKGKKHITDRSAAMRLGKDALDETNKIIWRKYFKSYFAVSNFIKMNVDCFSDGGQIVKHDQLKFSFGNIELPSKFSFQVKDENYAVIQISWDYSGDTPNSKSTDRLRVYSIFFNDLLIATGVKATRGDKSTSFIMPFDDKKCVHLYLFFVDTEGENGSDCFYKKIELETE